MRASQMESYTPPKYLEMRKIARSLTYRHDYEARLFYKQGKFMEDFEDDFDYRGEFIKYFPTYQTMSNLQLRGYFSWRAKVRRGAVEKTSLSFAFVYIYELINQIGVKSPGEGFYSLKSFWERYRELDARITPYAKAWLKDYVIYYNLDKNLLEGVSDLSFADRVLTLLEYQSHSNDDVFSALNSMSSYDLEKSAFYKRFPDDVKAVVCAVFDALSVYYGKNRKNGICEKFFGKISAENYFMFRSAVFFERERYKDFVYEINAVYKYRCKNGVWSRERFMYYKGKNKQIGELLRTADYLMRQKHGYKSTLKEGKTTKLFSDIIVKEIDRQFENKRKNALPKIEIDVSKLNTIRKTSLETQGKLIVEEEVEEAAAFEKLSGNNTNLSDTEYEFMKCLLYGRDYRDIIKPGAAMPSVLADSINEKLFDIFGDTVIAYGSDEPKLIEDYTDELKGIIGNEDT